MGIEENGRHVKTQEEKEQHLGIEGTLSVRGFILLIILLFVAAVFARFMGWNDEVYSGVKMPAFHLQSPATPVD